MKRTLITLAALAAALGPAAAGLWGNASFSQAVPVRVPASGQVATLPSSDDSATTRPSSTPTRHRPSATSATTTDDHGGRTPRDQRTEPGDDRDARGSDDHGPTSTSSSSGRHSGHSSSGTSTSRGSTSGGASTVDDHGGDTPRDQRTEPGDDHGGHGSDDQAGDDHGGHGSDD
jgi:hypothetical protein